MSGPCRSFFHTILHSMCVTVGALLLWAGLPTLGLAQQPPQSCARHNGTWLEQYRECEYASKEWCGTEGGQFDECASACRHDPNLERPCTMQCVPVCKFPVAPIGKDPEDSTYVIEGRAVTLKDCCAEEPAAPDSAAMTTTRMFKPGAKSDLNGDGRNGAPVLLVQNPGGSGSFSAEPDRPMPLQVADHDAEVCPLRIEISQSSDSVTGTLLAVAHGGAAEARAGRGARPVIQ
jgi:hypothetical protein